MKAAEMQKSFPASSSQAQNFQQENYDAGLAAGLAANATRNDEEAQKRTCAFGGSPGLGSR